MRMSVTGWQQFKRKTSKKATRPQHNFKTGWSLSSQQSEDRILIIVTTGNDELLLMVTTRTTRHTYTKTMEADQEQVPPQFVRTFTCYRMATTNADNVRQNSMVCYWMVTTTPHSVKLEWWYGCFWRFAGNVSQIGTDDYVQWFGRRYSN
jgi:hypothetical protein